MKSKMRGIKGYSLTVIMLALMVAACNKDYNYVAPAADTNPDTSVPVSFKNEIQPIFNSHCTTSGCHDGTVVPDLRPANSYASLMSTGSINTASPTQSDLYRRITVSPSDPDFMPEGGSPLSNSDVTNILIWIKQGAKDN